MKAGNKEHIQQISLARYPQGAPTVEDFRLDTVELAPLAADQVRVEVEYLSMDPYLRPLLAGRYLAARPALGAQVPGMGVGVVCESRIDAVPTGSRVVFDAGWAQRVDVPRARLRIVDTLTNHGAGSPAAVPAASSLHLGALGLPGLTAWAGLRLIAPPAAGQTVLISAAAGAVGSVAGQLARWSGARAVGIVGSAAKRELCLQRYGFSDCVSYRDAAFPQSLDAACPDGIDVYFDNVGGVILEAALARLSRGARIVLCGLIDQYNSEQRPPGPNLGPLIGARASMTGLVVHDHWPRLAEMQAELLPHLADGSLAIVEDIFDGLRSAPEAFCALMRGDNLGKALVRVAGASG